MMNNLRFLGKINRSDLYIASWCLYYLQGTLYAESSILSKSLFAINMLVALFYVFEVNNRYKLPAYFKGLNWLLLLFTVYTMALYAIYGAYVMVDGEYFESSSYVKAIYLSLFPIYPFYAFAKKGYVNKEKIRKWAIVFIIITTASYFYENQKRVAALIEVGSDIENVTNNTSYVFLSLVPFLVFYKKYPIIQYIGLSYIAFYVISGMKRGAILIAVICICIFIYDNYKKSASKKRLFLIVFTFLWLFIGIVYLSDYLAHSSYFQIRLAQTMEGKSSGRDEIYSHIWSVFINSDLLNVLLGYGANGSIIKTGKFAHSDWLEILINQGLVGVFFYLYYWKQFYKTWKTSYDIDTKSAIGLLLIIFFIKSIFSMSYASMTFYTNYLLGYCLAKKDTTWKRVD